MTNQERIAQVEYAQEKLNEGLEALRDALRGSRDESSYEAYILGHLNNWINGGNPYDESIPKIVEALQDADNHDIAWYRGENLVGEETFQGTEQEAWHYAELKANNEYNADDFEVTEKVRR